MGEYVEDQEVSDVAASFQDYSEENFLQGEVNGAFIVTDHADIGKFSHSSL